MTTLLGTRLNALLAGEPMLGVIAVHQRLPIGDVVDDLLLVASCSLATDRGNRVSFLSLR